MLVIEPFKRAHLEALVLQPMQEHMQTTVLQPEYLKSLEGQELVSGFIDGRIVACGGFLLMWPGRIYAWSLLSHDVGPREMLKLHCVVRKILASRKEHRIEAACDSNFKNAHRWLRALGFQREAKMRCYTPDGRDCDLYARIR